MSRWHYQGSTSNLLAHARGWHVARHIKPGVVFPFSGDARTVLVATGLRVVVGLALVPVRVARAAVGIPQVPMRPGPHGRRRLLQSEPRAAALVLVRGCKGV